MMTLMLLMMTMMNSMMIRFDDDTDVDDGDDDDDAFNDEEDDEDDDRTTTRTPNGPRQTPRPRHRKIGRDQTERRHDHHRRPIGPPTATVLTESPGHDVDDDSVRPDNRPTLDDRPDRRCHHQTTTTMMAI